MKRNEFIKKLSDRIEKHLPNQIIFIAVDGVDSSGKTTLAEELKKYIKNREVVRVSIDGFHNTNEVRLMQGEYSPEGYFEDSFNYEEIKRNVFEPIKNGKNKIIPQIFNYKVDSKVSIEEIEVSENAVIIFDGVFMLRSELSEFWDISIFLDISFKEVLKRALVRDLEYFKNEEYLKKKYNERYIPGQKIYFKKENPKLKSDIIVDNNDCNNPILMKWGGSEPALDSAVRAG